MKAHESTRVRRAAGEEDGARERVQFSGDKREDFGRKNPKAREANGASRGKEGDQGPGRQDQIETRVY